MGAGNQSAAARRNRDQRGNGSMAKVKTKPHTNGEVNRIKDHLPDIGKVDIVVSPAAAPKRTLKEIRITAPKMEEVAILIRGTSPYCQNRFSQKAMQMMKDKQMAGSVAGKKRQREAKDFQACFEQAKHVSAEGWCGIPAPAFRNAIISACRLVGFKMTIGKLSVFVPADGVDRVDFTPLVKITKGEPQYAEHAVRNDSGVADIRPRPIWTPGWEAIVRVRYDAEQFSTEDVLNLMRRVGEQVGIGEGRPDSPNSCGLGWGLFGVVGIANSPAGNAAPTAGPALVS
jgi:hypothetical protein